MSHSSTETMSAAETGVTAPVATRQRQPARALRETRALMEAPAYAPKDTPPRNASTVRTISELARQALRTVSDQSRLRRDGRLGSPMEDDAVQRQAPAQLADDDASDHDNSRSSVDDSLLEDLVRGPHHDAQDLLRSLRARNLTDEELIEDLIPGTARLLGQRWMESRLSFTEVNVATSLLQALIRLVASRDGGGCARGQVPGTELLIVVPENEQHTLGAQVAAEQLRGRGLEVDVALHEDVSEIVARLTRGNYGMIIYSIAQREVMATVRRDIEVLRGGHGFNIPIVIAGWIAISTPEAEVIGLTGADGSVTDAGKIAEVCGIQ